MTDHDPHREGPTRPAGDGVSVLLIADPGKPADLAEHLSDHLPRRLTERGSPPRRWTTTVRRQPLVSDEHASLDDVIDTVDTDSDLEDIVVYLTDLTRRVTTVVELALARILGEPELAPTSAARRFPAEQHETGTRYLAPKGLRTLRLVSGMVRANRPWRLVTGLSKVLVGAFATGAFALSTSTIWSFADTMGGWRLCAATILSTVALILWLVIDHELWERP